MPAANVLLPDGLAPTNLHLRPSVKVRFVEGDVFLIADRLRREVDENLHVIELTEDTKRAWAIMEHGADGVERLVFKTDVLDGRVIEKCQRMIRVPFHVRVAEIEAENARWEKEQHDKELETLYDRIGGQMWFQLDHDGFIPGGRPVSYAKKGVAQPRRHR